MGSGPFQSRRIGTIEGTRADRSSSTILVENHPDGGDRPRGRGEGDGRFYLFHEALFSHWDEALEDVEGSRELSESLIVLFGLTRLSTSSMQADHLESQMRVQLEIQEGINLHLEQRDEELHQL